MTVAGEKQIIYKQNFPTKWVCAYKNIKTNITERLENAVVWVDV